MKTLRNPEEYSEITTLRHKMHCTSNFAEWMGNYDIILEFIDEIDPTFSKKAPAIDDEAGWCNRDDCGEYDCQFCREKENAILNEHKDSVNSLIEDWLAAEEEKNEMEENAIAPTGCARHDWACA